jgi:hypothetical protein
LETKKFPQKKYKKKYGNKYFYFKNDFEMLMVRFMILYPLFQNFFWEIDFGHFSQVMKMSIFENLKYFLEKFC